MTTDTPSRISHRIAHLTAIVCGTVALFTATNAIADTASSVEQYGITWHFESEREVGRYANGDWWVLGPVTITSIDPASTVRPQSERPEGREGDRVMHGTMIDLTNDLQGYDSDTYSNHMGYDHELNVDPAATGEDLVVEEGTVASVISTDIPDNSPLDDLAILTVVEEPPIDGAFRPGPYSGDTAVKWSESELDYGVLRDLPMLSSAPDLESITDRVSRFWIEQSTGWQQSGVYARNNQPSAYGRDVANVFGQAMLSLHLDYSNAEKRDLFVNMVQRGIDIFDRAKAGGVWVDDCGHNHGRKMAMLFAGLSLGDKAIVAMADADDHFIFQEDRQTFIVSEDDLNNPEHPTPYTEDDLGMPAWGCKYTAANGDSANRDWVTRYRWVGSQYVPNALTAHVMQSGTEEGKSAAADWNYRPFFAYVDRYVEKGSPTGPGGTNGIKPFVQEFWDEYRHAGPGGTAGSSPNPPQGLSSE